MKTGLYIGRFQPFHLGHLSAIKQALKQVDKLYIGIGSSQYNHQPPNPFTAKERQKMIALGLKEAGLNEECEIFPVPDIHDDEKWVDHVRSIIPPFQKYFTGNRGLATKLFKKDGQAKVIKVKHELDISATKIRKAMQEGSSWEKMVSLSIMSYLKEIDAEERLRQL